MDPQQAADDQNQLTQNPVPTIADDVEEFEAQQDDYQAMYNAGGHFKEQLEAISQSWKAGEPESVSHKEVMEMREIPSSPEVSKEVAGYMEKIEKEAELANPVTDDYTQSVLLSSASSQKPQVKLPLTPDQIQEGLHHKVYEAIRWLAEWCGRQLKMV